MYLYIELIYFTKNLDGNRACYTFVSIGCVDTSSAIAEEKGCQVWPFRGQINKFFPFLN